ncbi:hypothetical protein AAFN86_14395 [Roseomonas sp. CAU 1739]
MAPGSMARQDCQGLKGFLDRPGRVTQLDVIAKDIVSADAAERWHSLEGGVRRGGVAGMEQEA